MAHYFRKNASHVGHKQTPASRSTHHSGFHDARPLEYPGGVRWGRDDGERKKKKRRRLSCRRGLHHCTEKRAAKKKRVKNGVPLNSRV